MPSVTDLSAGDRQGLMKKLAGALKDAGLNARVTLNRETVCPIMADSVEDKLTIDVEGKFPPSMKEKCEAFQAAAKEIVGDTQGVNLSIGVELGAGSPYDTIKGVTKVFDTSCKEDLVH